MADSPCRGNPSYPQRPLLDFPPRCGTVIPVRENHMSNNLSELRSLASHTVSQMETEGDYDVNAPRIRLALRAILAILDRMGEQGAAESVQGDTGVPADGRRVPPYGTGRYGR